MARATMVGLLVAAGCGGSVEGSVAGKTLQVASSAFVLEHLVAGQAPIVTVMLSDAPDLCGHLESNSLVGGSNVLQLALFGVGSDGGFVAVAPGKMPVMAVVPQTEGEYGAAFFSSFDSRCQRTLARSDSIAVGGLIRLESLDPAKTAIGTFDVILGSGDELKGSFEARRCTASRPAGPGTCE